MATACHRSTPSEGGPELAANASAASTASDGDAMSVPIGLGLTVGDVRTGNELASRDAGPDGPAMAVCLRLASAKLVAHCTNIGGDRSSFELPDPTKGRGMIRHFENASLYNDVVRVVRENGIPFIANADRLILFLGAHELSDAERELFRVIVQS